MNRRLFFMMLLVLAPLDVSFANPAIAVVHAQGQAVQLHLPKSVTSVA